LPGGAVRELGGTFTATALAIFYVPLFFVLLRRIFRRKEREQESDVEAVPSHAA
jgi:multidrug efflux pump